VHLKSGGAAWMLVLTALGFFMLPGLALFYRHVPDENVARTPPHNGDALLDATAERHRTCQPRRPRRPSVEVVPTGDAGSSLTFRPWLSGKD
jgi:hypothetical protein